jgi:capsular exopolysaccharide synthesis family protein
VRGLSELIMHYFPQSPIAEAYRSIRTNIECANIDQKVKTILVTSATEGEGKTTTLCNIAMTFSDIGKKVLIMDCDFRKPRIHRFFSISNKEGLTEVLLEGKSYRDVTSKEFHPNIEIMPCGKIPKNPSELLCSEGMKKLINGVREEYDYIFIDTPPVIPVTDAAVMAGYIDGVVLVCASKGVDARLAKKAKYTLEKGGAKFLGVVLNKISMKEKNYKAYYTYKSEGTLNV